MIYSGLDWSEDPGGPDVIVALVFVDGADQAVLEQELAAARVRLQWGVDDVFKHTDLIRNTQAHQEFYRAIRKVTSLRVRAHRCNRSTWTLRYVKARRGDPCVCDAIVALTLGCPDLWVADQTMYIDIRRKQGGLALIEAYRTAVRQSLREAKRRSFGDIKPRPDNRLDSGLVQAADMFAGEVREHSGLNGPYLPSLGTRVQLV